MLEILGVEGVVYMKTGSKVGITSEMTAIILCYVFTNRYDLLTAKIH